MSGHLEPYGEHELYALRYRNWKVHFQVKDNWFAGQARTPTVPQPVNLRVDPFEQHMDAPFYPLYAGQKLWTVLPAAYLLQMHAETFKRFPPRQAPANFSAEVMLASVLHAAARGVGNSWLKDCTAGQPAHIAADPRAQRSLFPIGRAAGARSGHYVRVAVAGRDLPAQDDGPYDPAADGSIRRWTFARGPDKLTPPMVTTVAVGVDGSATAAEAVKMAAEVARRFEAELVLLTAYNRPDTKDMREAVAQTEAQLRQEGIRCRALADEGYYAAEVLVHLAKKCGADILVVGNKGMQRRALGSIPNTVAHTAECSVLVVKTT